MTMNNAMKRAMSAAIWLITNLAMGFILWVGIVDGIDGARNLGLFLVWAISILSITMLIPAVQEEISKKGRSIPRPINIMFDFAIACFLAWHGYIVTSIAYAIHIILQEAGFEAAGNIGSNQKDKP